MADRTLAGGLRWLSVLLLVPFLTLTWRAMSTAQPKKTVIDGDGELLLCMPLPRFTEGPGKTYAPTPPQRFPEFAGAAIYSRPDFWRGRDYLMPTAKAAVFVRERLVAILHEGDTHRAGVSGPKVYDDLKSQLLASFDVFRQEGSRLVVFGPVSWWFILTDGQGNRAILERETRTGLFGVTSEFVRVKYFVAGFPPGTSIPLEWANLCLPQPTAPTPPAQPGPPPPGEPPPP